MRVLIDITHPAHVHFFRPAIAMLKSSFHDVLITTRDKDITHALLEHYRIPYNCISKESHPRTLELAKRDWKLYGIVRAWKPDVLASVGGVSTAWVGWITRKRNVVFYDTEYATVQNLISYPFASEVVVPESYEGWLPKHHSKYKGHQELAYLDPKYFTPDINIVKSYGIDPHKPFFIVRFVSDNAIHDKGIKKLTLKQQHNIIGLLSKYGCVLISYEHHTPRVVSDKIESNIHPAHIHHFMAYARLLVGDSPTMAAEAGILGTPFILFDPRLCGVTSDLEYHHLGRIYSPHHFDLAIRDIVNTIEKDDVYYDEIRSRFLESQIDVTGMIVTKLLGKRSVNRRWRNE